MASTKKGLTARIAAGFAATAVASLTVLGGALPASAAPDNVDTARIGSITVHKFAEPEVGTGLSNNGTVVDTTGLTALEGVEFTVQHVSTIDLATNAGWDAARTLSADAAAQRPDLVTVDAIATDRAGVAAFTGLAVGVYLVTETSPGANAIAVQSAPFLVSIPLAANNGWLYDVHVYPKNSLTSITKTVDDSSAFGLGDQVSWTIRIDVPEIAASDRLDVFEITDAVDARLRFDSATVTLTAAGVNAGEPRRTIPLTFGTHYTGTAGQAYEASFTAAGRQLLAGLNDAQLTIEAVTTVTTLGDGIINNVATLTVNSNAFRTTPATTEWGTLAILKHVTGDEARVLAGAEFQIFTSLADATSRTNPVEVSGVSTFTSGENGIAWIPGLRAGDYWIVEIKAPVGYQLVQTPTPVTVDAGDVSATSVDVKVPNALIPAYTLPITGGAGQAAFMIGGAGLLAAALGFALFRRRKADAEV